MPYALITSDRLPMRYSASSQPTFNSYHACISFQHNLSVYNLLRNLVQPCPLSYDRCQQPRPISLHQLSNIHIRAKVTSSGTKNDIRAPWANAREVTIGSLLLLITVSVVSMVVAPPIAIGFILPVNADTGMYSSKVNNSLKKFEKKATAP